MNRPISSSRPALRILALAIALLGASMLGGCSRQLSGTYKPTDETFALIEKIVFTSGDKVEITGMGMTKEGTYEIDGDRVKITISGETNIFTIAGDCIDGGGMLGKFCKS